MSIATQSELDVLVARQPIFDRTRAVAGYELLYRSNATVQTASGVDTFTMTCVTLTNGVLGIGLDHLVGETKAWINISQESLESNVWTVLDPQRCVIEILETVQSTPRARAAIARIRDAGFCIALDDYVVGGPCQDLLPLAHIVKLEMTGDTRKLAAAVRELGSAGLTLLAERVETAADYRLAYDLGFDLFQGWHFARAETVVRREMSSQMSAVASVMHRMRDPDSTDRDVEAGFQADPSLMIKLLKIANSAAYGHGGVESARQALQLVGRDPLDRWLAILLVASVPRNSGMAEERLRLALERARFCELAAGRVGQSLNPSTCFLAGLLAKLHDLLGVSIDEMLDGIRVSDDVRAALVGGGGALGAVLRVADALEQARLDDARDLADAMGFGPKLPELTTDAMKWAALMRASLA